MKDQTIDAIDDTLVNTGDFLKEIVDHPLKHKCLKLFGECQGLIKWLREFTKSKCWVCYMYGAKCSVINHFFAHHKPTTLYVSMETFLGKL